MTTTYLDLLKEALPHVIRASELRTSEGYCHYCGFWHNNHYHTCESLAIKDLAQRIAKAIKDAEPLYKPLGDKAIVELERIGLEEDDTARTTY